MLFPARLFLLFLCSLVNSSGCFFLGYISHVFCYPCLPSPDPFVYSLNQMHSFLAFAKKHFCMLSVPPPLVTADFARVSLYNSLKIQSHIPCYHARVNVQTAVLPFSTKSFLLLVFVDYHVCEFAVG